MSDQPTLEFSAPETPDEPGLGTFAERAYLEYAMSVVKGRALPDVGDGQKPVQRRILYAMERMGLGYSGNTAPKPVKSARVVGDVLGQLSPARRPVGLRRAGAHGAGLHAALSADRRPGQLRLARRRWRRGDALHRGAPVHDHQPAARARSTTARSTSSPTTTARTRSRASCPARLPFMLLNGASGIAVGLATEIPTHNLREVADACVALIKNPQLPEADLLARVPGPDFPGGGQIISAASDIADAYRTGRGSLQGARALEDRGPGARPVAAGGHRTAARREHAEGARGNRGAHQPEDQDRQEGAHAGADPAQGQRARGARHGARRVRARTRPCAWCSSPRPARRRSRSWSRRCSRTPAWRRRRRST